MTWSPVRNDDVSWNFEKVLIDHNGQPYRRYSPPVLPEDLETDIVYLRSKCIPSVTHRYLSEVLPCGILALCLGEQTWIKHVGVFLIGTTDCVSEVTAVALTAYFDKITIMAFCVGSGIAYVLGPLYYTVFKSELSFLEFLRVVMMMVDNSGHVEGTNKPMRNQLCYRTPTWPP
ncbi:hypothetical protein QZH41_007513 [Actinostola sp. cb2023]|nr:hypothetical protein QZH41_007513 [Actinostola sp. cb2023]